MYFETSTSFSPEVENENGRKMQKICKIALIAGIIGLILYIVIGVACFEENEEPFWLELLLGISSVAFALGLILPWSRKAVVKKSEKATISVTNTYQFFEEYLITISVRNGDKIAEVKNYYTEFTKVKRTENYLFLHMGIRGAYPIQLSALSEEQIAWLHTVGKGKTLGEYPKQNVEKNQDE